MVRNPALYNALIRRFGKDNVQVVRQGEKYDPNWKRDPITGKLRRDAVSNGEAYRLNCPKCGDRRERLYVNHFWMQYDEEVQRNADDMIRCFNEECFANPEVRGRFFEELFSGADPRDIQVVDSNETVPAEKRQPTPPGKIISLAKLHPQQPARYYLRGRGYDVDYLCRWFNIGYVQSVDRGHKMECINRIYIPMIADGTLVGYQCRYIGDREWTPDCPKSITMPGMPRGQYLYNLDFAKHSKVVVIVEGPTSLWKVGLQAIALWGRTMTEHQVRLMEQYFVEKCLIVVLLDGDAWSYSQKLLQRLTPRLRSPVVAVPMEYHADPGKLTHEENWALIDRECRKSGYEVRSYLEGHHEFASASVTAAAG